MLILRNLHVTYEDDNGYFDEITTDIKITIPENLNYQGAFDEILKKYTKKYSLVREYERNGFPAFIEAIRKVKPQIWLCENVKGLPEQNKEYFEEVFLKPQKVDILIVSDELYTPLLQRHDITYIFVMKEQNEDNNATEGNIYYLYKYIGIQQIFSEILGKSIDIFKPPFLKKFFRKVKRES